MKELMKLVEMRTGPKADGKEFIKFNVRCEFEPFGLASEDWDIVYEIEFPQIPYMIKNNNGKWVVWNSDHYISFKARTYDAVINKAKNFLIELSKK